MDIMIDAGHGGRDPGASARGVHEKDWTLEVSLYQYRRFRELGVRVGLTRDEDITLEALERAQIVRESGATYCLSNHFNAGGGSGCEAIHSAYTQPQLAETLVRAVAEKGMPFRRVYYRKRRDGRDYYYMHRLTGPVKTTILEYGFLDHPADYRRLDTKAEREKYAEAVVAAFCDWLGVPYSPPGAAEADIRYRVQVGAFRFLANARQLARRLRDQGFPAIIKKE